MPDSLTLKSKNRTAKELVIEKYPTAFVDDDGDWVNIRTKVTESCQKCSGTGKITVTDFKKSSLGSGGTSSAAWKSAAQELGLLP